MNKEQLKNHFEDIYEKTNPSYFFAPGRVNLIGEHTDYNGGHVFPCAITQGTYAAITLREDKKVRCYSFNFKNKGIISFGLDELIYKKEDDWASFVKGTVKFIEKSSHTLNYGFDLFVYGNIPNGAGLSSSASLELLIGVALNHLYELKLSQLDLVKVGQKVENDFIGLNSGIMDQFAVGMAQKDKALFLDTNTLEYELIPVNLGNYALLIMNTNKGRELTDSKYNDRREQCDLALERLQEKLDIDSLGELDEEMFKENRPFINDDVLERRAKHAVYENIRTIKAKKVLQKGDLNQFGELLNESHISLRDDYAVTGKELDTLVELAWQQDEVLGARMTGAGMGGCAITLVDKEKVNDVKKAIASAYEETMGYSADFYIAEVGDGAKRLK